MNRFSIAVVVWTFASTIGISARAQEISAAEDISAGRTLALKLCSTCHVVSPDQAVEPIRQPPAPNFRSIANKPGTSLDSVRQFLDGKHGSLGNPGGMQNPLLNDDQMRQATAFLMSLRDRR